jgi:hypothetical protein
MEKVDNPNDLRNVRKLVGELQEQAQEEKGKRFEKELDTLDFPIEMLTDDWICLAMEARRKSSPQSHRIGLKEFSKAVNFSGCQLIPTRLSLFQFGILYNSLEIVSQEELRLSDESYETLLKTGEPALQWYSKTVKAIREKIEADVDQEFEMKRAAIVGNASNINGGFKPILGKA